MWGYRFLNEMCQHWQDKPWKQLDEVTPYNIRHRRQRGVLDCVGEFHFRRYCGAGWDDIGQIHKASKRKKLYWRLHPEYKDW
jgi:hypothetical protein